MGACTVETFQRSLGEADRHGMDSFGPVPGVGALRRFNDAAWRLLSACQDTWNDDQVAHVLATAFSALVRQRGDSAVSRLFKRAMSFTWYGSWLEYGFGTSVR